MSAPRAFDLEFYKSYNTSREAIVGEVLSQVGSRLDLRTAVDVGCGFGYFSGFLHSLGFQVTAVDGRSENLEEARRRVPQVSFRIANVEDTVQLRSLGHFDLVLCLGLLYHLENPFLAMRNLQAITSKLLLVESVIFPGSEPIMGFVDEVLSEDQGLNHMAFYPTESCLAKMMYKAGFTEVYRFAKMPDHPDFHATLRRRRVRTMLLASFVAVQSPLLERLEEPRIPIQPWIANSGKEAPFLAKLERFARKPFPAKVTTMKRLLKLQ